MSHEIVYSSEGVIGRIDNDRLRVSQHGDVVLDACLTPVFDGRPAPLGQWVDAGKGIRRASLGRYGEAFIGERQGRLAYWIETTTKSFDNVTYLSDGVVSGAEWRSFVSDEYDKRWDARVSARVPISSAYDLLTSPDGDTGGGMTDPDDFPPHWVWNIHVRAFALHGRDGWLGVSIPGPWGIGVTRMTMDRMRFSLSFEAMHAGCTGGRLPVVYFLPDLTTDLDALDAHRVLSEELGLMDLGRKTTPEWWLNPWYGYWDEFDRQLNAKTITKTSANILALIREWLAVNQRTCGRKSFNLTMEQGCYRLYGDYRPAPIMGQPPEVRAVIDSWRGDGIHVGHYLHPFLVNTKLPICREHPEAFCKPKKAGHVTRYALETWDEEDPTFALVDWTHPAGRKFMLDWVRYLLSSDPGCMNFDILRSNHWRSPDPRIYDFHDPDWGVGDMMTFRVQKLLYDTAKEVKPGAMVTKIAALDCYMQPTFDLMEICEEWTPTMGPYYRRLRLATHVLRNTLVYLDPWFVTRTKWNEYYMGLMALIIPENQSVEHTVHPYYPSWRKLEERHFHRRKSGILAYANSPPHPSDELHLACDDEPFAAWRVKTAGPLAGFTGARALGTRGVVTYSETEAVVVASESRLDWIELPPGAVLEGVTRELHDGGQERYEHMADPVANRVRLFIEDCGGPVACYRIAYRLGKAESAATQA
jgi:hypothetical protein